MLFCFPISWFPQMPCPTFPSIWLLHKKPFVAEGAYAYLISSKQTSLVSFCDIHPCAVILMLLIRGILCMYYRKASNTRRTLVSNTIIDHLEVVGASPVGATPTTSSVLHSRLNTWLQWIGQRQLQDETRNIYVLGFSALILDVWWYIVNSIAACMRTAPHTQSASINLCRHWPAGGWPLTQPNYHFSLGGKKLYTSAVECHPWVSKERTQVPLRFIVKTQHIYMFHMYDC